MSEKTTEILVIGGSLGGCAAALAACRLGRKVILTEETDWIGGQLTSQAVPPDEHPWIETTGCTASYRRLREIIRQIYRDYYPMLPEVRERVHLNPGAGKVSRLCTEPRVAWQALNLLLAPYIGCGQLEIILQCVPIATQTHQDRISAVSFRILEDGSEWTCSAEMVIDATELGDVLELACVEHVIGAESQAQTGELHALPGVPDPLDQQAVTWCFAVDHLPGEDHTITQPENYDFWRSLKLDFWPGPQLGWHDVHPHTLKPRYKAIFDRGPSIDGRDDWNFWLYRRIFCADYYSPGAYPSDITLVNWPANDYWLGPLAGVSPEEKTRHLHGAQQLSLALLYWMQTEAPRPDGGQGYPGLRLRGEITGTQHGLAKSVYVRESRRIQAEFTILEQHIGVEARPDTTCAETFIDSVGIGSYRIDLHPSTTRRNYVDISNYPFQIPLGALMPVRVENLLPACKNLGTTHITNGCYRLHPVEWNIGEAAGALAAWCLNNHLAARQVRNTPSQLADFQKLLVEKLGFELAWPEYARRVAR